MSWVRLTDWLAMSKTVGDSSGIALVFRFEFVLACFAISSGKDV